MSNVGVGYLSLYELHRELVCNLLESSKAGLFFSESEPKKERVNEIVGELLNRLNYVDIDNGIEELMKDRYFRAVYGLRVEVKEMEYL